MGTLVIISSPSGGGKDSVINELLPRFDGAVRFVTTTSRQPRPGNVDGVDYHFIDRETFEAKLDAGEFLEHNHYAGNLYGSEKGKLENDLKNNDLVFTQIEVNGKKNVDSAGIKHLSIFLVPESLEQLRNRIEKRGGLTEENINERLEIAKAEMAEALIYDHKVVNYEGKLEETVDQVEALIRSYHA